MKAITLSTAFTTDKIDETRDFYLKYFDAKITFDCGWYLNLEFGHASASLQFMTPQEDAHKLGCGNGIVFNFNVEDVDKEYERLTGEGLVAVMPLEDHPWGDRGFCILDPNGISLYIYSEKEPSEEFKQYYK